MSRPWFPLFKHDELSKLAWKAVWKGYIWWCVLNIVDLYDLLSRNMHFYSQGVMKVRKRVTLMVITVSSIFGISWGTSSVSYALKHFTSHSSVYVVITNTMALFNSAVNPFVYALFNQQFREKVKRMMRCTFRFASRIGATRETENAEGPKTINHTTNPKVAFS